MYKLSLSKVCLCPNEDLLITVETDSSETQIDYIQIDIIKICVTNPKLIFSTSTNVITKPRNQIGEFIVKLNSFSPGYYEIKRVTGRKLNSNVPEFNSISGNGYKRSVFKVLNPIEECISEKVLLDDISSLEQLIEDDFNKPIKVKPGIKDKNDIYTFFVFIKNILISSKIRFDNFEILPLTEKLGNKNEVNFVNEFLRTKTQTGIVFLHENESSKPLYANSPVLTVHFPRLVSENYEAALEYTVKRIDVLISLLSLTRGATGSPFEIVAINRNTGEAHKSSFRPPYTGNIMTGSLSGDDPDKMNFIFSKLESDPFKKFLADLLKEAKNEQNSNFQYVRYWQILEVLSEHFDFNPNEDLKDFDGKPILDKSRGSKQKLNSTRARVFQLLKKYNIGQPLMTWEKVNIWIAIRNTVAHFGDIDSFEQLRSNKDKKYASIAYQKRLSDKRIDHYLWDLKGDVDRLLMTYFSSE